MTTKEKIIDVALTLFSIKGFESVSVRDISRSVGIKESSLYNHFKNKQDIFDTIIVICQERATQMYQKLNLSQSFQGDYQLFQNISEDFLLQITYALYSFYVNDDYLLKFRKLLTIEQFNNEQIGKLYQDMFIDQAITFQSSMFLQLMKSGSIIDADPTAVALEFYSPIFLLLCRYQETNDEVKEMLRKHIVNFSKKNTPVK